MTSEQNKSPPPQHTPGDWEVSDTFIVAPDPAGHHPDIYIAELVTEDDEGRMAPHDQIGPNGDLLAEAPAMLKALQRVAKRIRSGYWITEDCELARDIDKLIEAAGGQP